MQNIERHDLANMKEDLEKSYLIQQCPLHNDYNKVDMTNRSFEVLIISNIKMSLFQTPLYQIFKCVIYFK